ncbi:MAG: patatin-like phospholipase family protein [candidate division Zixibacteria bacterium]|nr:patatin-like phospholipase family protein [candidate division Zixibacteria bacterium]
MAEKIKIGLALGGGGARGLAHIGVLKALEEEEIPIDVIAGTSMGAIVGGAYAQSPDSGRLISMVHELINKFNLQSGWMEFLCQDFNKNKQKKESLLKGISYFVRKRFMYFVGFSKISLEPKEKLMDPLKAVLKDEPIGRTKIPFACVAVDLVSGEEVVIKKGSMINAVYASSSIEGVFPPLPMDNQLLSDGGVTSLVPVDAVRKLAANFIIGVNIPEISRKENRLASGIEVILRADSLTRKKLNNLVLTTADVIITPEVKTIHWANFGKVEECIQKGYEATKNRINEIKEKIGKKKSPWIKLRKNIAKAIAGKH